MSDNHPTPDPGTFGTNPNPGNPGTISKNSGTQSSVLDGYIKNRPPLPHEAESNHQKPIEHSCYCEMPVQISMLDLKLGDGSQLALPYFHLECMQFQPPTQSGGGIKLIFHSYEVGLQGQNLQPLYQALTGHRVSSIKPAAHSQHSDGQTTIVKAISVNERQR